MSKVLCQICQKEFYVKPSHQKLGWGRYCSTECRTISQFRGKNVLCTICNKETYKSPLQLKRSKSGKFFCSKRCQTIWRNTVLFVGENHANWAGGESIYRKLLKESGKLEVCTLCQTQDKRVLMVHHFDKNRKNNKISNLISLCNNCHYLVHHYEDERNKLTVLLNK